MPKWLTDQSQNNTQSLNRTQAYTKMLLVPNDLIDEWCKTLVGTHKIEKRFIRFAPQSTEHRLLLMPDSWNG